jgi:hypothetical protein
VSAITELIAPQCDMPSRVVSVCNVLELGQPCHGDRSRSDGEVLGRVPLHGAGHEARRFEIGEVAGEDGGEVSGLRQ